MNPNEQPEESESVAGDEMIDDGTIGEELSLEDLGAAYARAAAAHDPDNFSAIDEQAGDEAGIDSPDSAGQAEQLSLDDEATDEDPAAEIATPEAIIEGVLFVGHPENQSITEERLAKLMRGMTPEEVRETIEQLNDSYRANDQALRIVRDDLGYKMTIAPEVEHVRRAFLGKVREARLNQAAIEVLSLVAYQPGITAQTVQDQRGRESNSLLNQLVRRQLIRLERKPPEDGGRPVPHYYPTERFLFLFGIESLDELPIVEEGLREGQ